MRDLSGFVYDQQGMILLVEFLCGPVDLLVQRSLERYSQFTQQFGKELSGLDRLTERYIEHILLSCIRA